MCQGGEARAALECIRKLLGAFTPGLPWHAANLRAALATPVDDAALEGERPFALGWAAWLQGDFAAAEAPLSEAVGRARQAGNAERLAEAAYWCARVRLRLGNAEALTEYAAVVRTLGGSPQATAWFVDLLWRAGRVDHAEQVWRSVCGNRRMTACPEAPQLEARGLLCREELANAERVLAEVRPDAGVVWVECLLLRAWVAASARQPERARALLAEARQGPYPAAALDAWTTRCERRAARKFDDDDALASSALTDYLRGQRAWLAGDWPTAARAYRAALCQPAVAPFARYSLACLGQDDPAVLLAAQPGLFLAVRCRARLAVDHFRRREISPVEFLDAVQAAVSAGYRGGAVEHFLRLAGALARPDPNAEEVRQLALEEGPVAGNFRRAALEAAVRGLPPPQAIPVLLDWSRPDSPMAAGGLGPEVGRQLLRLALAARATGVDPTPELLDAATRLLPGEPLLGLARGDDAVRENATIAEVVLLVLARAAADGEVGDGWRERVRTLRQIDRLKGLAQALLLFEAARRGDEAEVSALLGDAEPWRHFRNGPPRFVLEALRATARPGAPSRRRSLARWLGLWEPAMLGPAGMALAAQVGLAPAAAGGAPPGVAMGPWFMHQASLALASEDAAAALACVHRALEADPDIANPDSDQPGCRAVREAVPELERCARAAALAAALAPPGHPPTPAVLLVDAVDFLAHSDAGRDLLAAAERQDVEAVAGAVEALASVADLPARLAHHLALLEQRAAQALDDTDRAAEAVARWRQAWRFWLRFLAAPSEVGGPAGAAAGLLLDHMLAAHRGRVNDLLGRGGVEDARRYAALVQELPAPAAGLREEVAARVARFREELATEYLVSTREAMRYGDVPEGYRSDYVKGLGRLQRLLSLDSDNVRLLTTLLEICAEWFFDLYRLGDWSALIEQVGRFTPFAMRLARLADVRPGELAARAAVAEFYKFRGFVSPDPAAKAALYREALRFDPANANVRDLLAGLDPAAAQE
jgi:hypothetical protein